MDFIGGIIIFIIFIFAIKSGLDATSTKPEEKTDPLRDWEVLPNKELIEKIRKEPYSTKNRLDNDGLTTFDIYEKCLDRNEFIEERKVASVQIFNEDIVINRCRSSNMFKQIHVTKIELLESTNPTKEHSAIKVEMGW